MDPAFAEAFIHALPRPFNALDPWSAHRVLGKRLRPFSLWHSLLLEQMGSPFVAGSGPDRRSSVGPIDLARAVAVCRCRYPEVSRRIRLTPTVFWKLLGRGLPREVQLFREYVADFQTRPDYRVIPPKHGIGPTRGQPPEYLRLVQEAMAVTNCSRAEAWEMPPGEARWWFALGIRARGADLDFYDEEHRAAEQQEIEGLKVTNRALYEALRAASKKLTTGHG